MLDKGQKQSSTLSCDSSYLVIHVIANVVPVEFLVLIYSVSTCSGMQELAHQKIEHKIKVVQTFSNFII